MLMGPTVCCEPAVLHGPVCGRGCMVVRTPAEPICSHPQGSRRLPSYPCLYACSYGGDPGGAAVQQLGVVLALAAAMTGPEAGPGPGLDAGARRRGQQPQQPQQLPLQVHGGDAHSATGGGAPDAGRQQRNETAHSTQISVTRNVLYCK